MKLSREIKAIGTPVNTSEPSYMDSNTSLTGRKSPVSSRSQEDASRSGLARRESKNNKFSAKTAENSSCTASGEIAAKSHEVVYTTKYPEFTTQETWSSMSKYDKSRAKAGRRGWYISPRTIRMFLLMLMIFSVSAQNVEETYADRLVSAKNKINEIFGYVPSYEEARQMVEASSNWFTSLKEYIKAWKIVAIFAAETQGKHYTKTAAAKAIVSRLWTETWISLVISYGVGIAGFIILLVLVNMILKWFTKIEYGTFSTTARYRIRVASLGMQNDLVGSYFADQLSINPQNPLFSEVVDKTNDAMITTIQHDSMLDLCKRLGMTEEVLTKLRRYRNTLRNAIVHHIDSNVWKYDENLYEAVKSYKYYTDQMNFNLKLTDKEKSSLQGKIDFLENEYDDISLWEIDKDTRSDSEGNAVGYGQVYVKTARGIEINKFSNIFVVALAHDAEHPSDPVCPTLEKWLNQLLEITTIKDIRTNMSGNPVVTLLQQHVCVNNSYNKLMGYKENTSKKIFVPVEIFDRLRYLSIRGGIIDLSVVKSAVNSFQSLILTEGEKADLITWLPTIMAKRLVPEIESNNRMNALLAFDAMQNKSKIDSYRWCHRVYGCVKSLRAALSQGCVYKSLRLLLSICWYAFWMILILNLTWVQKVDDPVQKLEECKEYNIPGQNYEFGPQARKPAQRKPFITKGNPISDYVEPKGKTSFANVTNDEIPDVYDARIMANKEAGILDRLLVENRLRTVKVSRRFYDNHPELQTYFICDLEDKNEEEYKNYILDEDEVYVDATERQATEQRILKNGGWVVVQRAFFELNGEFGSYLQEKAVNIAQEILENMMGPSEVFNVTKEEFRSFLSGKHYNQKQIERMLSEVPDILESEIDFTTLANLYGSFVKQEEYLKRSGPRNINNPSSMAKEAGVILEQAQHAYFMRPSCIKLVPYDDRKVFLEEKYRGEGHFYQTDHSAFEGAQMDDVKMITEFEVFKTVMPKAWNLLNLLYRQGNQEEDHYLKDKIQLGRGDRFKMYIIDSMRMSGAADTSFGNTIVNECVTYALLKMQNITDYVATFEGDDALIMTKTPLNVSKVFDDSTKAGFKLKLDVRENARSAGFLSMYWDENMVTYNPNPAEPLSKVFTHYDDKLMKLGEASYVKSKLLSCLIQNPADSIIRTLYEKVENLTKSVSMALNADYWTKYKLDNFGVQYKLNNKLNKFVINNVDVEKFITHIYDKFNPHLPVDISHEVEKIRNCQTLHHIYAYVSNYLERLDSYKTGIHQAYDIGVCYFKDRWLRNSLSQNGKEQY